MPGLHMSRTIPPETLTQARNLFDDGASQSEIQRTTGLSRETLRKHFPGQGWTYQEGGEFRQLIKDQPRKGHHEPANHP